MTTKKDIREGSNVVNSMEMVNRQWIFILLHNSNYVAQQQITSNGLRKNKGNSPHHHRQKVLILWN